MKPLQFAVFVCACIALKVQAEAFPSAYAAPAGPPILLTNATILDGAGARYDNTSLYLSDGKVMWIGSGEKDPDAVIVDATDRWITPGLIDVHSHLGVYPSPGWPHTVTEMKRQPPLQPRYGRSTASGHRIPDSLAP